jgi:hypothetical protein
MKSSISTKISVEKNGKTLDVIVENDMPLYELFGALSEISSVILKKIVDNQTQCENAVKEMQYKEKECQEQE